MVRPKLRRRYNGHLQDIKSSGSVGGWISRRDVSITGWGPTVLGNSVTRRKREREGERERERERERKKERERESSLAET
jgi:hypothetical protein